MPSPKTQGWFGPPLNRARDHNHWCQRPQPAGAEMNASNATVKKVRPRTSQYQRLQPPVEGNAASAASFLPIAMKDQGTNHLDFVGASRRTQELVVEVPCPIACSLEQRETPHRSAIMTEVDVNLCLRPRKIRAGLSRSDRK